MHHHHHKHATQAPSLSDPETLDHHATARPHAHGSHGGHGLSPWAALSAQHTLGNQELCAMLASQHHHPSGQAGGKETTPGYIHDANALLNTYEEGKQTGHWKRFNHRAWTNIGKYGGKILGGLIAGPRGAYIGSRVGRWMGGRATPATTHGALAGLVLGGPLGMSLGAGLGTLIGRRGEQWIGRQGKKLLRGASKAVKGVGHAAHKIGHKVKKLFGF